MSSEFLRELEEDIRSAKMRNLWQRYGNLLIGLSLAVVLGTAAGVAWKAWRVRQHTQDTSVLIAADNNPEALHAVANAARGGSAAMAGLRAAGAFRTEGKAKEAIAVYAGLAEDTSQDAGLRAIARVLALHTAAEAGLDAPFAETAPKPDEPFALTQREAQGWLLVKQGKNAEAASLFNAISADPNAPLTQRKRAGMAAAYLNEEAKQ